MYNVRMVWTKTRTTLEEKAKMTTENRQVAWTNEKTDELDQTWALQDDAEGAERIAVEALDTRKKLHAAIRCAATFHDGVRRSKNKPKWLFERRGANKGWSAFQCVRCGTRSLYDGVLERRRSTDSWRGNFMGGHHLQRVVDVGRNCSNLDLVSKVCWLGLGDKIRQSSNGCLQT